MWVPRARVRSSNHALWLSTFPPSLRWLTKAEGHETPDTHVSRKEEKTLFRDNYVKFVTQSSSANSHEGLDFSASADCGRPRCAATRRMVTSRQASLVRPPRCSSSTAKSTVAHSALHPQLLRLPQAPPQLSGTRTHLSGLIFGAPAAAMMYSWSHRSLFQLFINSNPRSHPRQSLLKQLF